jgi:hypothetical protein
MDLSLSRCTASIEGFVPEVFKLTPPTPNKEYDCARGIQILIPDIIAHVIEHADVVELAPELLS